MIELDTEEKREAMLTHIRNALIIEADRDDLNSRLNAAMDTGAEMVNRKAPDAPASVAREALIRFVGSLFESGVSVEVNHAGMFRRSGAASLLAPWIVRRAGAIKRSTSD